MIRTLTRTVPVSHTCSVTCCQDLINIVAGVMRTRAYVGGGARQQRVSIYGVSEECHTHQPHWVISVL